MATNSFGAKRVSFFMGWILLSLLVTLVSCGEESTTTPAPTAQPTAAPVDIQSLVQQVVAQVVAGAPTPAPGISPEDIPSIEAISSLVQAAVAASVPEGTTPDQIRQMVQAAVQAAQAPGVTRDELEQVVSAAVDQAVEQAVAQITPVATAMPTTTATPSAAVEPTSVLDVGATGLGPPAFRLRTQGFFAAEIDKLTTHEGLFATSPENITAPLLVKEWGVDSTGLVYTFRLQEGVNWHQSLGNWGEFTADDVLFSFDEVLGEGSIRGNRGSIRRIFGCDGCQLDKLDDYTLRLTRPSPTVEIVWNTAEPWQGSWGIHSKAHFEAAGPDRAEVESVGTGPWELVEARSDQFRRMQAMQDHWRKTPEWAELVMWDIAEESTRLANFLTGELDTATLSLDSVQDIQQENDPEVKFLTLTNGAEFYLNLHGQQYYTDHPAHQPGPGGEPARVALGENAYDCTLPWVSCDRNTASNEWDMARKVRLAMSIAIDRQKLVNNLAGGSGAPQHVAFWIGHEARMGQLGLDDLEYQFDPARARQLLTEAGYPGGFAIDMFLTARPLAGAPEAGQAVASMWQDVGITANQTVIPYPVLRPSLVNRTAKGINTYNGQSSIEPVRSYFLFYDPNGGFNFGFEHPEFQGLIEESLTILNEDRRFEKQAEAARWVFENIMTLPLYTQDVIWPLGPEIDEWPLMAGAGGTQLNNWEYVPHRR